MSKKNPITMLQDYVRHSVAELNKVTWPTKTQTRNYTILVLALSVATAVFFTFLDTIFSYIIETII